MSSPLFNHDNKFITTADGNLYVAEKYEDNPQDYLARYSQWSGEQNSNSLGDVYSVFFVRADNGLYGIGPHASIAQNPNAEGVMEDYALIREMVTPADVEKLVQENKICILNEWGEICTEIGNWEDYYMVVTAHGDAKECATNDFAPRLTGDVYMVTTHYADESSDRVWGVIFDNLAPKSGKEIIEFAA